MMYYSILASFCLLGMAGSQIVDQLTACLTKDQSLQIDCKFTPIKQINATCTYEVDKKVVATNDPNKSAHPSFKTRGMIKLESDTCVLTLKDFLDDGPKKFNCTIRQEKSHTKDITVEKKNMGACSAGNTLKHNGVILLLAFVFPLLSGML